MRVRTYVGGEFRKSESPTRIRVDKNIIEEEFLFPERNQRNQECKFSLYRIHA